MNSRSHNNCSSCCELHTSILKCGCPGSVTLQAPSVAGVAPTPIIVSSVTIDTSCLCEPDVKLEFASNIILPLTVTAATFTFQIFKLCSNQLQRIPVGAQWSFSRLVAVGSSDTFSFFVCDEAICNNECCTYTVEVTPISLVGTGTVLITNAAISALAVGEPAFDEDPV